MEPFLQLQIELDDFPYIDQTSPLNGLLSLVGAWRIDLLVFVPLVAARSKKVAPSYCCGHSVWIFSGDSLRLRGRIRLERFPLPFLLNQVPIRGELVPIVPPCFNDHPPSRVRAGPDRYRRSAEWPGFPPHHLRFFSRWLHVRV